MTVAEPKTIEIKKTDGTGTTYNVMHVFTPYRVLFDYGDGLPVLADFDPRYGTWDESVVRANDEENAVIRSLIAQDTSQLTITKE